MSQIAGHLEVCHNGRKDKKRQCRKDKDYCGDLVHYSRRREAIEVAPVLSSINLQKDKFGLAHFSIILKSLE